MQGMRIRDLYSLESFGRLRLIAGADGLDNTVASCGLLDYEYDAAVKGKYYHTNFIADQLVLTSLLYAKDNPFLLDDAVKNLISRRCSGLIIKNVFKLPIHDSVIRFADSKNFPIFVIKDDAIFFEDLIYEITDRIRRHSSIHHFGALADAILGGGLGEKGLEAATAELNPAFLSSVACGFYYFREPLSPADYLALAARAAGTLASSDRLFYYKNGIMAIHTGEMLTEPGAAAFWDSLAPVFGKTACRLGVSDIHHRLAGLRGAMLQAIHAALLYPDPAAPRCLYASLGSFAAIIPHCRSAEMQAFSHRYLKPILDYDVENNVKLYETILNFVLLGGEIDPTAAKLGQHKNTIRYRLDILNKIAGVNIFSRQGYETVAMALRIHLCERALDCFGKPPYYWEENI
ncbi:PucR family transcriptional regulator ligand-binding domain-containing protein [Ruminococcaceae bacterium OttesenSCG-928-A11]|nr:PucR family transcriptional regulator ligand-binding domain-containing protein [Ruminococcaceae bacterium OttesenSCG-928-A11]